MSAKEQKIIKQIRDKIIGKEPNAEIILYGSRARGTAHRDSDWDFIVLLDKNMVPVETEIAIRHSLLEIELEIGEVISVLVYSKNTWDHKFQITPFYRNVVKEGRKIA